MTYSEKLKDPRWQKKRLEVLQRDGFSCANCGEDSKPLHVHHICYSENPWDTPLNRLQTLCETCHKEEEYYLKRYKESIFKDLRNLGFTSSSFASLPKIFDTDRGWSYFDPAYDILKMVVDDDDLWKSMYDLFFDRLMSRKRG